MKGVWRYAGTRPGALCVMIHGLILMQLWPVNNLDTKPQVNVQEFNSTSVMNHLTIVYETTTVDVGVLNRLRVINLSCHDYI